LNLRFDNSEEAVQRRKQFLIESQIGICDIVESAKREKIDASDLGMKDIKLRNIIGYLKKFPAIKTLLFIGGNSKNGPEYLFRKLLKKNGIKLDLVSNEVPRIHEFKLSTPIQQNNSILDRKIRTVSLSSSSGAANISISRLPLYKKHKAKNPKFNTFDFRVLQYSQWL